MSYDIIVVGGGASGMAAAIMAARQKKQVALLEQKDRIGKKILATGNGKCNYTNEYQSEECYRSKNKKFPMEVLSYFGKEDTIAFFSELGIYPKRKKGYLYPNSEQASAILDVLRLELEYQKIDIFCDTKVKEIQRNKRQTEVIFSVYCEKEKGKRDVFIAKKVILSTGGKASPKLGSDGSGYMLAESCGHHITPIAPALIGLKVKEKCFKSLSGIRIEAHAALFINQHFIVEAFGELQLTSYGISGIPIFQISRYAALAMHEKKSGKNQEIKCKIDFIPTVEASVLLQLFLQNSKNSYKKAEEVLIGFFPKKLNPILLQQAGIPPQKQAFDVLKEEWRRLCDVIKHFWVTILDSNGFENAQVTAGGVDTREINSQTMESKCINGIYITGELLDVDGICGGYNLQWAWSTGALAGKAAAKSLSSSKSFT